MFNKHLKEHIKKAYAEKDEVLRLVSRAVQVLGLQAPRSDMQRFNEYGSIWYPTDSRLLSHHLDAIEADKAALAERDKLEKILRDLLKSNVFKQV
jgi:hypothetical protein